MTTPTESARDVVDSPPVIMIVEDNDLVRVAAAKYLIGAGFQVVEASSAHEAIAAIGRSRADLVFTDINMPGTIDGRALSAWLEAADPTIPVIITSGAELSAALEPGNRRFIAKPYSLHEVETQIRQLLVPV